MPAGTRGTRRGSAVAAAERTFPGRYGAWTLTASDELEVTAYRASLTMFALSFDACALATLLPAETREALLDPGCALGAASLAAALGLVHMYVTPIKRAMQTMAAVGIVGAVAISVGGHEPVAEYVHQHAAAVWAVGPFFAALTGLAFKEGACYGKPESIALFFLVPALLLTRLCDAPDAVCCPLLALDSALITVWAARKWTQAVECVRANSCDAFASLLADNALQGRHRRQEHLHLSRFTAG